MHRRRGSVAAAALMLGDHQHQDCIVPSLVQPLFHVVCTSIDHLREEENAVSVEPLESARLAGTQSRD